MNKATKVAGEKYPHGKFDGELGDSLRAACAIGYMQAEKDLALTWEDMKLIHELAEDVWEPNMTKAQDRKCYEEVLRRFNKQREKK